MQCLECNEQTRKYKCPRCNNYCCSFDCFRKHKDTECSLSEEKKTDEIKPQQFIEKRIFQFSTDDTVDSEKLSKLADSEPLKDLLRNEHLRKFLVAVDSSENAWKAMKYAMLEPLFIEFANECLKIVDPDTSNS